MTATAFDSKQFSGAYPSGMEKYWWNLARNKIISSIFNKYLSRNLMILEVGCGSGIVTDYLKEQKWNILGVDPGTPTKGSEQRHYITYAKEANDLPENTRKDIKVLALFDVLEHIPDPENFLSQLIQEFSNSTTIIVTVPARHELWTNFDDYYGHFRRYSLSELETQLTKTGLKKIFSGYFFHFLYLGIFLSKISKKQRKVVFKPPYNYLKKLKHLLLAEIFNWEFLLFPKSVPGSSIIAVYSIKRLCA